MPPKGGAGNVSKLHFFVGAIAVIQGQILRAFYYLIVAVILKKYFVRCFLSPTITLDYLV